MEIFHLKDFARGQLRIAPGLQRWARGEAVEVHRHDCVEIIHVIKGSGINYIDRVSYPIISGDLFVVNPGSTHAFTARSELFFYNLLFSFKVFSRSETAAFGAMPAFRRLFRPEPGSGISKLTLAPPFSQRVTRLFESLYRETADGKAGFELNARAYLALLITELCRLHAEVPAAASLPPEANAENSPLARILNFINRNFRRDLQIGEIAQAAHLSVNYVGDYFRRRTGVPLVKYIATLRVEYAGNLLRARPEMSISEAAFASGFNDSNYFARSFRAVTGKSPSEYRGETLPANEAVSRS